MSTKLTNNVAMVESKTLSLVLSAANFQELVNRHLCKLLKEKGHDITPSNLNFLSTLECGINYGSEIARNLKVSRQMVAKTVKELCKKGYLEQTSGHGKQKQILFTRQGEHLMSESRQLLAELDTLLFTETSSSAIKTTLNTLNSMQNTLTRIYQNAN